MEFASKPFILKPSIMTSAKWREVFAIALDDLASLVSPKTIIYCEGRDRPGTMGQERGFDALVLNTIFSTSYQDTLFVSSGGNTELDQRSSIAIAIISKALPGLDIKILKDRDISSGQFTTEQDRQTYLSNNDSSHRVLRRWEIENYLYDKEVLTKYCSANNMAFDSAAYDAYVTDIENQNLKDETARIKGFCSITTSINTELFKKNLANYISPGMPVYEQLERCIFYRE